MENQKNQTKKINKKNRKELKIINGVKYREGDNEQQR